jgi:hypothetical protein
MVPLEKSRGKRQRNNVVPQSKSQLRVTWYQSTLLGGTLDG